MKKFLPFLSLAILLCITSCQKPVLVMTLREYVGVIVVAIALIFLFLFFVFGWIYDYISTEIKKWRGAKKDS